MVRNLPGAPFAIGETVVIREENITPWSGEVFACKPTKQHGWYVSILRDGCEIVVQESFCTSAEQFLKEQKARPAWSRP